VVGNADKFIGLEIAARRSDSLVTVLCWDLWPVDGCAHKNVASKQLLRTPVTSLKETAEPKMDSTHTPTAFPTPVGARDSFGKYFSVELDQVLTDWLTELDRVGPENQFWVDRI